MTVWLPVECTHCHSTEVVKHGKSALGKQRYRCQNEELPLPDFCFEQDLRRRHLNRWMLELLNQIVRKHSMLNLIDSFTRLVGERLETTPNQ